MYTHFARGLSTRTCPLECNLYPTLLNYTRLRPIGIIRYPAQEAEINSRRRLGRGECQNSTLIKKMPERERIVELVDRLSRIAHTLQFSGGLNPAQWEALRFVDRANHRACSPSALADFMGTTKGTASQTIKALEAKGLVQRGPVAGDGRAVRISITEAGNALLRKDPLGAIHDALTACSPEDRLQLVDGMQRLVGAVQRSVGAAEFGRCTECEHYRPERFSQTNSFACRCAVYGDLFSPSEIDKICADFSRKET